MKRREFISLLGGTAGWPLAARAQQRTVIGFLSSRSSADSDYVVTAFQRGLAEHNFVDGRPGEPLMAAIGAEPV